MCPHSGFRSEGPCERTLVPVFVPGEHPQKPSFWKTTLLSTLEIWAFLCLKLAKNRLKLAKIGEKSAKSG